MFSGGIVGVLTGISTMTGFFDERRDIVPYIPTLPPIVERMLSLAGVGQNDIVLDMGSGDGRIVIAAAQRGARGRGVDIDSSLVDRSKENARNAGVADRTEFLVQDMFETPMHDVTVLTLYVLTSSNLQLRPRILKEMKPGTRVVSHQFGMGEWQADRQEFVGKIPVHLWIIPASAGGNWRFESGDDHFTLEFTQQFQKISGVANVGGIPHKVRLLRFEGTEINFEIERVAGPTMRFHGIVSENSITPVDASAKWRGTRIGSPPTIAR